MEHFCSKCDRPHIRPVGRKCITAGMATNVSSTQPSVAPNGFLTQQLMGRSLSPINTPFSGSTVNTSASAATSSGGSVTQPNNTRTDELILAELQKLSARKTNVEQELQADTFTSTPRKRRRAKQGRQATDNSLFGTSNRSAGISLEESTDHLRGSESTRVPVHTQSVASTTTTTISSLFAQANQGTVPNAVNVNRQPCNTQIVYSMCQPLHQGQHVRLIQSGQTPLARTQGPLSQGLTTQGPRVMFTGITTGATASLASTASSQGTMATFQHMGVGTQVSSGMAQPFLQSTIQSHHMARSHLPNTAFLPLVRDGGMAVTGSQQVQQAGRQATNVHVPNAEHPGVPSIQALRTTAVDQALVQQRLQELNQQALPQHPGNHILHNSVQQTVPQITSKAKGKKEKVDVVWPQDCAFVGHLRARVTYEQLTQAQFVLGFLRSVQEEQDPYLRSNMVEYLTKLYQNACDHSWQVAKGAHLVVMTKMEEGLVTWGDLKKVNKVRKTYVKASNTLNSGDSHNNNNTNTKKVPKKPSSVPCREYNEGRCSRTVDHDIGLITHKHVCAFCMYTLSRLYSHPESQCNNKKRRTGNAPTQQ